MKNLLFPVLVWLSLFALMAGACQKDEDSILLVDERDGQEYKTVRIGEQVWMAENLNYVTPDIEGNGAWYYDNNRSEYEKYGLMYDWYTARNICPQGWHLPSDEEWKTLERHLGMSEDAIEQINYRGTDQGHKLKASQGWSNNGNGSDEVGFAALPGGDLHNDGGGDFVSVGIWGLFWSSTTSPLNNGWAYFRTVASNQNGINRGNWGRKENGLNCRCVKD